ncbi:hypothetical protein BVC71_02230 [Marivivens niveibacter]|uniref:N-acetyltransferase domain-containing protein n=1 Tax=Marivivens niveibacter TaxID=1930667 RepID=A0A251X177_9RHOB|nr:GNAT family N-acetyltransferase [Marivivens niveibacter]OUD10346.1 hypothetical protein BVC71_02230 [Marivivens niveibacter]
MIRLATQGDLPAIQHIVRDAFSPYIVDIGREPAPMTDDYAALINQGIVWLIDDCGVMVLKRHDDHLEVKTIAVSPAAQGQGYGRQIMQHCDDVAGGKPIRLLTNAKMIRNIRFYQACGYRITDKRSEDGFDRIYFEKP